MLVFAVAAHCEMKLLNSTVQLVEPFESRKFARFSLSYIEKEMKPDGLNGWEPRFAGHQSLREREDSFMARDQKINCGFVKGPEGYSSTGFDFAEDDQRYISRCHIAVISCIFGNSDKLRSPFVKAVGHFCCCCRLVFSCCSLICIYVYYLWFMLRQSLGYPPPQKNQESSSLLFRILSLPFHFPPELGFGGA